jgi:predicted adenylyl cyclase CyaB
MAVSIELRARLDDVQRGLDRAAVVTGSIPREVVQEDVFFNARRGRLFIRREESRAELISYSKAERPHPRPSAYFRQTLSDPDSKERELKDTFGVAARVAKRRWVFEFEGGRIHIDDLGQLGAFVEIAVQTPSKDQVPRSYARLRKMARAMGVREGALIGEEYETLIRKLTDART